MEYLSADKILVVDLETGQTTEDELSEDLVKEKIGGAAINRHLFEEYQDADPIVIGTGLLTGSLYPASAAAVITAKSPISGKICHCPVTLKVGLEIKFSGFDYIVIKNAAKNPSLLWIHDGVADINDASDLWGRDVWETTDVLRKNMGDDLVQTILIGPAGEAKSDVAQVCLNYWSSGDRFGFGKLFGEKNLKGLAFRGMGLLEIAEPEEFVEECQEILKDIKEGEFVGKAGIGDMLEAMGKKEIKDWLSPIVHRHSACYNTPYATNSFVYLTEDPKLIEEPENETPGLLITDVLGLEAFFKTGLDVKEACSAMLACAKLGADCLAVASLCKGKSAAEIEKEIISLKGEIPIAGNGIFSPWAPQQPIFGEFEDADDQSSWWERRQAISYIFGIHPIFSVISPDIMEEDLVDLAGIGTDLELSDETLNNAIDYLLK